MNRVLVANRGEIAVRIIRACHEVGMESVAVYSEVDSSSLHVQLAGQAVELGPAPPAESYLDIERLLWAASQSGADAVHPGYGFLAESAEFAEAVERAGLTWVGPPPGALRLMGNKTEARRQMIQAGVPVVPGSDGPTDTPAAAAAAAEQIGYPVLLKASAGGGGKGMRRVARASDLESQFERASSEARSAFGNGAVYVESLLERPRHVEIQVLGDRFGNTLHLGERECSIQRRHQKLIEESPSPAVDLELRAAMGRTAVKAAKSVGYWSAGTVEFLLAPDGEFYFLEMNTRLQVEHPITEAVYGVDLVREQLRIALGRPTTLPGRPMVPRGHALECRITAEDPFNDFLPAIGTVEYLRLPCGPGIRWDGGIDSGSEVSPYYDSLVGKLVAWADNRESAIVRMQGALDELVVVGVPTSQPFHRRVMAEPNFKAGDYDIEYLDNVGTALLAQPVPESELQAVAIAAALSEHAARNGSAASTSNPGKSAESPWLVAARRSSLR
ncbi:MAG: acetyl/propionyl/methylcrotonyl-CoA carboxylase subunit alpha [Gemmatimonadales bacterium]